MNNRKNDKRHRNSSITYYFDVDKCKVCPLREGCYKEGAKTTTYARNGISVQYTMLAWLKS